MKEGQEIFEVEKRECEGHEGGQTDIWEAVIGTWDLESVTWGQCQFYNCQSY